MGNDTYFNAGMATDFMMQTRGKTDNVEEVRLSLLAILGTLIMDRSKKPYKVGIVISASKCGVKFLTGTVQKHGDQRVFVVSHGDDDELHNKWHITDPAGIYCADLDILPPAASLKKIMKITPFSTTHGLKGMSVH